MRQFFIPLLLVGIALCMPSDIREVESEKCSRCQSLAALVNTWRKEVTFQQQTFDGACERTCGSLGGGDSSSCGLLCGQLSWVRTTLSQSPEEACQSIGHCIVDQTRYLTERRKTESPFTPVVLMHGITSNATSMDELAGWIAAAYPGIYIKNLEVGNGFSSSFLIPLKDQINDVCKQIKGDANLASGFDLIGFSQGTAITRGYIEFCNYPKVRHYISLAGVHGGIFGEGLIPKVVDRALAKIPYDFFVQHTFTFAQLWKDPFNLTEYLSKNIFFPNFNNEKPKTNQSYRLNILSLATMVLFYSPSDDVIRPQQAGWFEFYEPGQDTAIIPLTSSAQWDKDLLGIKSLADSNRLVKVESDCLHTEHVGEECKDFILTNIFQYIGK